MSNYSGSSSHTDPKGGLVDPVYGGGWFPEARTMLDGALRTLTWCALLVPFLTVWAYSNRTGEISAVGNSFPAVRFILQIASVIVVSAIASLEPTIVSAREGIRRFGFWFTTLGLFLIAITLVNDLLLKPSFRNNRPISTTEVLVPGVSVERKSTDGSATPSGFATRQSSLILAALGFLASGRKYPNQKFYSWGKLTLLAGLVLLSCALAMASIREGRHDWKDIAIGFASAHFLMSLLVYVGALALTQVTDSIRILVVYCFSLGFTPMAFVITEAPTRMALFLAGVTMAIAILELRSKAR